MGRETRLYIVIESDLRRKEDNKCFAEVVGMIDISRCPLPGLWETEAGGYIFGHDGNTEISADGYGDPLMAEDINTVIDALCRVVDETNYRRAKVARDFLKSIRRNFKKENLMVYSFCH